MVLKHCKAYLQDSRRLRDIVNHKRTGKSTTRLINLLVSTKKIRKGKSGIQTLTKTEAIECSEIERRKVSGKCLRCAWPKEWTEIHRIEDCIRPMKLDKGTGSYLKMGKYLKGLHVLDSNEEVYDLRP